LPSFDDDARDRLDFFFLALGEESSSSSSRSAESTVSSSVVVSSPPPGPDFLDFFFFLVDGFPRRSREDFSFFFFFFFLPSPPGSSTSSSSSLVVAFPSSFFFFFFFFEDLGLEGLGSLPVESSFSSSSGGAGGLGAGRSFPWYTTSTHWSMMVTSLRSSMTLTKDSTASEYRRKICSSDWNSWSSRNSTRALAMESRVFRDSFIQSYPQKPSSRRTAASSNLSKPNFSSSAAVLGRSSWTLVSVRATSWVRFVRSRRPLVELETLPFLRGPSRTSFVRCSSCLSCLRRR